jgi:hypothetical protein
MAETAWTEEGSTAPPKKRVPTWLWFCGGGCLLAMLLGVVALGLGYRFFKKATDPEAQKASLAKILPYDEWPSQMTPVFAMQLVGEQYTIQDSRGFQEQIQLHRGKEGTDGRKQMFDSANPQFPKDLGVMEFQDLTPGTVDVQGRDLHLLRMRLRFTGIAAKFLPKEAQDQMGSMAFVDLTPDDLDGMLLLQITRTRGDAPITDDDIRDILKPFHIGPTR